MFTIGKPFGSIAILLVIFALGMYYLRFSIFRKFKFVQTISQKIMKNHRYIGMAAISAALIHGLIMLSLVYSRITKPSIMFGVLAAVTMLVSGIVAHMMRGSAPEKKASVLKIHKGLGVLIIIFIALHRLT